MTNTLTGYLLTALMLVCSFGVLTAQTYPRTVLIEEFTSATCEPCKAATPIINGIIADSKYQGHVVSIRYHLDFPQPHDPWYDANVPDNSARKVHYNITSLPAARIDGVITQVQPTNETDMRLAIEGELSEAPMKMEVTQSRDGNQVTGTVKVTTSQDLSGLNLMIGIVEAHIHVESLSILHWNGETDFYDVMRQLLPNSSGQAMTGQSKSYPFSYTIDPSWQGDQLYTVAFIEDPFDKSIVQAGYSPRLTSGVNTPESLTGFSLEPSTPNPASTTAAIDYSLGAPEHVTIELRDLSGALRSTLDEGAKETGTHRAQLDVSSLPSGVYSYTIRAGRYRESKMLTVVR